VPRIPLVATVVGALLVGGATTGSTVALWRDQAGLAQSQVESGRLSYTASTPSGVTVAKTEGSTADTVITVDDTSLGKNIAQRITANIGSTPAGVTATVGTTCGGTTNFVDTTPASTDQTFCVRVASSTSAVDGNVAVSLNSVQRPGAGWSTPTISRSVAVTVTVPPAPTGPANFRCGATTVDRGKVTSVTLSWDPVAGSSRYVVRRVPQPYTGLPTVHAEPTSSTTTVGVGTLVNNVTYRFQVTAIGQTESQPSTYLYVRELGNSLSCSPSEFS